MLCQQPTVSFFFLFNKFIYSYFWLHWVFVAERGLSLVAVSGGYSLCGVQASHCSGFSLLQSTGSRHKGSVVVAHGP